MHEGCIWEFKEKWVCESTFEGDGVHSTEAVKGFVESIPAPSAMLYDNRIPPINLADTLKFTEAGQVLCEPDPLITIIGVLVLGIFVLVIVMLKIAIKE